MLANILVDPILLYATLVLPIMVSIALRMDLLFVWTQFSLNALFWVFAERLDNPEYFAAATVVNVILAIVGYRTSPVYTVLYVVSAAYTYARMHEHIYFSGGVFSVTHTAAMCAILMARYVQYKLQGGGRA